MIKEFRGIKPEISEKAFIADSADIIGDVKNEIYRQTAICVGDGVRTAMEIGSTLGGVRG